MPKSVGKRFSTIAKHKNECGNVIQFACHPERSAESAKSKDPSPREITDSSTRYARSE